MNKVVEAQAYIKAGDVARMQIEFMDHFRGAYDDPHLLAVGPMQSFLGLMIKRGYISVKE